MEASMGIEYTRTPIANAPVAHQAIVLVEDGGAVSSIENRLEVEVSDVCRKK